MLIVRPVADPESAEEICRLFGRTPDPDIMAYLAVDAEDPDDKDPAPLVLCRFTLKGGKNEIVTIDRFDGTNDTEALIITARTVMSFMYRCAVKTVFASDDVPEDDALLLGFKRTDGKPFINLEEFYKSPCHYEG